MFKLNSLRKPSTTHKVPQIAIVQIVSLSCSDTDISSANDVIHLHKCNKVEQLASKEVIARFLNSYYVHETDKRILLHLLEKELQSLKAEYRQLLWVLESLTN